MDSLILVLSIPVSLLLVGLEILYSRWRKKKLYRLNDAITNLNIGVGQQVMGLTFKGVLLWQYSLVWEHLSPLPHQPSVLSFLGCFFLFDFFFYWGHRWGHEVNIFWGAHVAHHQSEEYNFSVALRRSWFHNFLGFFIFLPIPLLGFPIEVFGPAAVVNTFYQFWIHTRTVGKLPAWLEFFLNTPSHHRVHHGINPKYINKNYGGMFIIWDRIFGTFQEEEEEPTYGITTRFKSWNPFWANLHYYWEMILLARRMTNWKDRFRLIVASPDWRPKELGGPLKIPEVDEKPLDKFDPKRSTPLHLYVGLQFVLITVGTMAFLYQFEALPTLYQWGFGSLIILSIVVCGGIFEHKKWVVFAEYSRLLALPIVLSAYCYWAWPERLLPVVICSILGGGLMVMFFSLVKGKGRKLKSQNSI